MLNRVTIARWLDHLNFITPAFFLFAGLVMVEKYRATGILSFAVFIVLVVILSDNWFVTTKRNELKPIHQAALFSYWGIIGLAILSLLFFLLF